MDKRYSRARCTAHVGTKRARKLISLQDALQFLQGAFKRSASSIGWKSELYIVFDAARAFGATYDSVRLLNGTAVTCRNFCQHYRIGPRRRAGTQQLMYYVFHDMGRVRIITEIKREADDASFDALLENYGEQTAAYQNTNVPLGMLIALDLTKGQSVGQHISALYRAAVGDSLQDGVRRGVLVVNIPGNRISPAVATQRGRKSHQGGNSQSGKPARPRSSAKVRVSKSDGQIAKTASTQVRSSA